MVIVVIMLVTLLVDRVSLSGQLDSTIGTTMHTVFDGTYCDLENKHEYASTTGGWGNGRVFNNACCHNWQVVYDPEDPRDVHAAKVVGCCPCGYAQLDRSSTECKPDQTHSLCPKDAWFCDVWYHDDYRDLGYWDMGQWVDDGCCPLMNTEYDDNGPSSCRKGKKFFPRNVQYYASETVAMAHGETFNLNDVAVLFFAMVGLVAAMHLIYKTATKRFSTPTYETIETV